MSKDKQDNQDTELRNPFEMSDEEIMNMPIPEDLPNGSDDLDDLENNNNNNDDDNNDEDNYDDSVDSEMEEESDGPVSEEEEIEYEDEDEDTESDSEDTNLESSDEGDEEEVEIDPENELEASESDEIEKATKGAKKEKVDNSVDYRAEYNKLKKVLEPFKANGTNVKVNSVDEALVLMQKGLGYNAKMTALKPKFRILKMLENHSLMDENKINWLIDLSKKDPKAINQLIKDSGIDPLEVDVEKETGYQPNSYQVSDKQIDVEQALDEIKETDTYGQTIKIIGEQWDEASRQALIKNPSDIKHINDQVASGIYKQIMDTVEYQRALGKLQGFSDYDAYYAVGAYMTQNQLFNGQTGQQQPTQPQGNQISDSAGVPDHSTNTTQNSKLKSRKKAASNTTSAKTRKSKMKVNPFSLSDEDFDKLPMPD
jgi:hypothetical protein